MPISMVVVLDSIAGYCPGHTLSANGASARSAPISMPISMVVVLDSIAGYCPGQYPSSANRCCASTRCRRSRSTSFSRPRRRPANRASLRLDRPSPTPPSPPLAILPFTVGGTAYHHDGDSRVQASKVASPSSSSAFSASARWALSSSAERPKLSRLEAAALPYIE